MTAVLKLQVKFSLPVEINNCTKSLRDLLFMIQEKILIKQVIQFTNYLLSAKYYQPWKDVHPSGAWVGNTIIHLSKFF